MNYLPKKQVQDQLGMIGYQKPFTVVFVKKDGSQRKLKCMLEKPTKPINYNKPVPVMDLEKNKWSSFDVSKVLYIGEDN